MIQVNAALVADTGEPHALLKPGELEAACAHPIHRWNYAGERDPASLAIGLMLAVARAHPFVQGNKRTAFAAGQLLLAGQGLLLDIPDEEQSAEILRRAMVGGWDEPRLVEALGRYLTTLEW